MPSHMGAGVLLYCLAAKEPKKPDALKGISRQEAIVAREERCSLGYAVSPILALM